MKFTLLALAVVVVLLAVLYAVDAIGPGNDYNDYPDEEFYFQDNDHTEYRYKYNMDYEFSLHVIGFVNNGSDYAVMKISDGYYDDVCDINVAYIVYNYTNPTPIGIIIPYKYSWGFPCLIFTPAMTLNQVTDKLAANNKKGSDYGLPEVELDGTIAVSDEEKNAIFRSNRIARRACRGRDIYKTARKSVDYAKNGNSTIYVITLEAELYITTIIKEQVYSRY